MLEPNLASQDVEVVCGRGAVDNLPVDLLGGSPQVAPREPLALVYRGGIVGVLIGHLQKPLHTATAVLWPLQLVPTSQNLGRVGLQINAMKKALSICSYKTEKP